MEQKIIEVLETIRPYLQADGGDLEFVKYEDGICYIKLQGACSHCAMMEYTLKDGIESALKHEIKEIKEVINVNSL